MIRSTLQQTVARFTLKTRDALLRLTRGAKELLQRFYGATFMICRRHLSRADTKELNADQDRMSNEGGISGPETPSTQVGER